MTYKVNGEVVPGSKNYWAQLISGLTEKKYEVTLDVVSKMGQRGTASVDFEVVKNAAPQCALSYTESNMSWSFTNKCIDTDGKLVRYEWYINDELRNVFGSTATLSKNLNRGKQIYELSRMMIVGIQQLSVRPFMVWMRARQSP